MVRVLTLWQTPESCSEWQNFRLDLYDFWHSEGSLLAPLAFALFINDLPDKLVELIATLACVGFIQQTNTHGTWR